VKTGLRAVIHRHTCRRRAMMLLMSLPPPPANASSVSCEHRDLTTRTCKCQQPFAAAETTAVLESRHYGVWQRVVS
jgi:hypothetical protein